MKRIERVFLVLGAALFFVLLRSFGLTALVQSLAAQGPSLGWILLPTAASYLFFCLAWWISIAPEARRELSFGYLFLVSIAGFSLNYMTPFLPLGGEPLKMSLLARKLDARRAVSSVIAYNALHVFSHVMIFLCAFVTGFWVMAVTPARAAGLALGIVACLLAATLILTCLSGGIVRRLGPILARLPFLRSRQPRVQAALDRLLPYDEGATELYRKRRGAFWLAALSDSLGRAVWTVEVTLMLAGVGHWIDPLRAFFLHSVSSLGTILTFFVPYELGVKEGGFLLGLKWLGLEPSLGIYVGVVSRLRELLWIMAGFGMMLALSARRQAPALGEETEG